MCQLYLNKPGKTKKYTSYPSEEIWSEALRAKQISGGQTIAMGVL